MKRRHLGKAAGLVKARDHTNDNTPLRDTMTEHIIVADEESTRTVTMRRPEKKNTLTQEMYLAISDPIDGGQSNPAIRCRILTGRSGGFTAGNDIGDFLQAAPEKNEVARPSNAVVFLQSLVNN